MEEMHQCGWGGEDGGAAPGVWGVERPSGMGDSQSPPPRRGHLLPQASLESLSGAGSADQGWMWGLLL